MLVIIIIYINKIKVLLLVFNTPYVSNCGPGNSAGIATGYELDGSGIEPLWGARFSAPVHTDPGAHLTSYGMEWNEGKNGQGVALTAHPI